MDENTTPWTHLPPTQQVAIELDAEEAFIAARKGQGNANNPHTDPAAAALWDDSWVKATEAWEAGDLTI